MNITPKHRKRIKRRNRKRIKRRNIKRNVLKKIHKSADYAEISYDFLDDFLKLIKEVVETSADITKANSLNV